MNSKVLFDEDGWKRLQDEVPKVSGNVDDMTFIHVLFILAVDSAWVAKPGH